MKEVAVKFAILNGELQDFQRAFNGDGFLGSRDGAKSSVDFAYLARS